MERLDNESPGSLAQYWRNPSVRNLTAILGILFLLAVAFILIFNHYSSSKLKHQWLDRETALLGNLAMENPEWAEKWLLLLAESNEASPEALAEGRQVMERYGLDAAAGTRWLPVIGDYRERALWMLLAGAAALFALAAVLLYRETAKQLRVVRRLAVSMEDAVKRNRPMSYRLYGEGDLGLLASGAQELSLRLRETIDQLHREKTFLKDTVADISHQLKTPLASLTIYVDLLQGGRVDEAHAQEFLERCRAELDRMEWLILTMLKLARLEADALEMNVKPAKLGDTARQAAESVRRLAEEKNVRISFDPSDEELVVSHDPHWLGEAIANLLKNAIEHSPSGSAVSVGWEETRVFTHLRVMDSGPGIDPRDAPHIFKKFYRSSKEGHGVGLGLPLAKSIVEKHGGVLSASPNPEGGTVFRVNLPLRAFPPESPKLTEL